MPVVPNLLGRQFAVMTPNKAWVSDITCIATDEDWLYLARAVAAKRPGKGLIHHSDRSSWYCDYAYQKLLQ